MTIRDDFDIEATKATLTRMRDEQRAAAIEAKEKHASGKTDTSRGAYNHASRAVAADFLLRACEAGPEVYDQALTAVNAAWLKGLYAQTVLAKTSKEKRTPLDLPDSVKSLFDAALADEANVLVTLPTKAETHVASVDDHNNIVGKLRVPVITGLLERAKGDHIRRRTVPQAVRQIAVILNAHREMHTDPTVSFAHGQ